MQRYDAVLEGQNKEWACLWLCSLEVQGEEESLKKHVDGTFVSEVLERQRLSARFTPSRLPC